MLWCLEWDFGEVTLKFDIFIVNISYVVLRNIFRQQLLKENGFFGIARLCGKYISFGLGLRLRHGNSQGFFRDIDTKRH